MIVLQRSENDYTMIKTTINGGDIPDEELKELQEYIRRGKLKHPHNELTEITIKLCGIDGSDNGSDDHVDITYKYAHQIVPQRFTINGGAIIEDFNSLNDAKKAEFLDKTSNPL